jgi:ribosomal protein L11 methylase PrmA
MNSEKNPERSSERTPEKSSESSSEKNSEKYCEKSSDNSSVKGSERYSDKNAEKIASSFRDPAGFVFHNQGTIYRQINNAGKDCYDLLLSSGLYDVLKKSGLLISHEEASVDALDSALAYKIIRPEPVPFISYPWEWSFSQLKDAALATLQVQKIAIKHGMSLKDCSAFNIQFIASKPVFIDTLSFEPYQEGMPWVAYRQFCQHFLAPLALMSKCDIRLQQLWRANIDGIPLDMASRLLPLRTWLNFSLLTHLHLHAGSQSYFADKAPASSSSPATSKVSRNALLGIIDSLESGIRSQNYYPRGTEWGDYYANTNYTDASAEHKKTLVEEYFNKIGSQHLVWDLGANTGVFSQIAARHSDVVVAFDIDPAAVEKNYLQSRDQQASNILPLLLDITNPSPPIGWENAERMSLLQRGPADTVMALALIHHLAISNNLPLSHIASFFGKICRYLIIEFVLKSDSQVQKLLASRPDIFPDYCEAGFELAFTKFFDLVGSEKILESQRRLYIFQNKGTGLWRRSRRP